MKKEDKTKLLNKISWKIFLAFVVAFTALYLSESTGYYEYEQHKNLVITEEQIKKFENDVEEGKTINIDDYAIEKETDYQNGISNFGLTVSNTIGGIITNGLETTLEFLTKMTQN
ncbi:MAG: hypothetical protein ACK5HP_03110 [Bacilli bacterium]